MSATFSLYAFTPLGTLKFPIRETQPNVIDQLVHESLRMEKGWFEFGENLNVSPRPLDPMIHFLCDLCTDHPQILRLRRVIHQLARLHRLFGEEVTACIADEAFDWNGEIRKHYHQRQARQAPPATSRP